MSWFFPSQLDRIESQCLAAKLAFGTVQVEVLKLNTKVEALMATLSEAIDGWRAYVGDLKDQLAQAVSGLADAQSAAQAAADALAAFQADDAATDASQLAAQAQADADAVQAALDAVKTPPVEPPVLSEPVDAPPAE